MIVQKMILKKTKIFLHLPNIIIDNKNDYEENNENPNYEQEEKIENKNFEHNSNIFFSIKNHIKNIIYNNYNEIFLYSLLHLFIQVIIIFIFTLLGFVFGLNEIFVDYPLVSIISTTLVIIIMYISALWLFVTERELNYLYIHIILYVPCMVFYIPNPQSPIKLLIIKKIISLI